MDRLRVARVLADMDDGAAGHERGVERNRDVIGHVLAQAIHVERAFGEPREQFHDRHARIVAVLIRPAGRQVTIRDHDAARIEVAKSGAGILQPREHVCIRTRREGLCLAHQHAQIGVFPFLDAAMRQAGRGEALERRLAQPRRARKARLRLLPFGRELLLGGVLDESDFSHAYSAATGASWNCA